MVGKQAAIEAEELHDYTIPPEEDSLSEEWCPAFWDNISGQPLDADGVRQAREEEMSFIRKMRLYDVVPIAEAYAHTGKAPIAGRWVDTNKGDSSNPQLRSRYVAKEFRRGVNHDLFAATPPLEALRTLLSMVASVQRRQTTDREVTLMTMDVSRAFFYAPVTRPVFVELPEEEGRNKSLLCARLRFSLYGTRDAPMN